MPPCKYPSSGNEVLGRSKDPTGVPHLQENAPPQDPTVGLCLGSQGGPRGLGFLLWARYPCTASEPRGDNCKRLKDFPLNTKTRIWP